MASSRAHRAAASASAAVGDAPALRRVIAQARFPTIASIERTEFVAPLQRALQGSYPVLRRDAAAPASAASESLWRFTSPAHRWRLTLAPTFLALESDGVEAYGELAARFAAALTALRSTLQPTYFDRVGLRLVYRLAGQALKELPQLVQPELLPPLWAAGTLRAANVAEMARAGGWALSEALHRHPSSPLELYARWGLLPAGATVDPFAAPALEEPSWHLDLDAFTLSAEPHAATSPAGDEATILALAEHLYAFIHAATTPVFAERYGGPT